VNRINPGDLTPLDDLTPSPRRIKPDALAPLDDLIPADDTDEHGDSDSDVFDLISVIALKLRDATDNDEHHAVGLIYDLAMGRTTVAEARAELGELTFRHA